MNGPHVGTVTHSDEKEGSRLAFRRESASNGAEWRLVITIESGSGAAIVLRTETYTPAEVYAWRAFLRGEAPRLGRDWLYDEDTKRYAVYTDSGHYRIAISVPRAILVPSVSRILELGLEEPER